MRSHFIGLKKDLKKQSLPMPNQLKDADNEKFVRKRFVDDHNSVEQDEHHYMSSSK